MIDLAAWIAGVALMVVALTSKDHQRTQALIVSVGLFIMVMS